MRKLSREVKRKLEGILRTLDGDIKNCERFLQVLKKPDDEVNGMSSSESLDYYQSITANPFHNTMRGYEDARNLIYDAFPELRP